MKTQIDLYSQHLNKIERDLKGINFASKNISAKSITYLKLSRKHGMVDEAFVTRMNPEMKKLISLRKTTNNIFKTCKKAYNEMATIYPGRSITLVKVWGKSLNAYRKSSKLFKNQALKLQNFIKVREAQLNTRLKKIKA